MPRKKHANSLQAQVDAIVAANSPLPEIPSHIRVREKDGPFLRDILESRAREEWMPADMVVAAQLARCQADIEDESLALEGEGSVMENQRGTMVMNPRHAVLQQLAQREMALMRALALGGTVARGDKRGLGNTRKLQKDAKELKAEIEEEAALIA